MFKKVFFLLAILTVLGACTAKEASTFTILGTVSSPDKIDYLLLKKEDDIERKISKIIDSIPVEDDGSFRASYNEEPHYYTLEIDKKKTVGLIIEKGDEITLTIRDLGTVINTEITGSKASFDFLSYEIFRKKSLDRLVVSVRDQIKALKKSGASADSIATLGNLELVNYDKHLAELNEYITNNLKGSLALYPSSIRWKGADNLKNYDDLVVGIEAKFPQMKITQKLREKVKRLQQTSIGGTVAGIEMPNAEGELKALSELQSDYILIDFWASWCGPCRREASKLNDLLSTYSRDQFDIYGVSLDDDRTKWLKALEKDQRHWTNVSTLERFATPAAYDYAVTALPDNFLIDKQGTIIAKNLHGEALQQQLAALINR